MRHIFISYSHEDSQWVQNGPFGLITWLARSLQEHAVVWYDRDGLVAGDDFRRKIEAEIARADIAVLLISQAFLNSHFIREVELPRIAKRATAGELVAIPLLLEPCFWDEHSFLADRQMIPGKPTPLIEYCADDIAWKNIRFEILRAIRAHVLGHAPGAADTASSSSPITGPDSGKPGTVQAGARGNLSEHLTAFIGRAADVQRLLDLLGDASRRLVTITGPGGIGKTKLAVEVARRRAADYADGVWFLDLRGVRAGEEIPSVIAETLRLSLTADRPVVDQVLAAMACRCDLLICDNCEQIASAAEWIGMLLRRAPRLTILATSRSPLLVQGERLHDLKRLSLPDDAVADGPAECDSVRLFVECARDFAPGWELDRDSAGVIAEICTLLEGIPLCIVLAASRMRQMTPREILAGLADRLEMLASRSTDLPPNQRTLRDMIDWSYALLHPEEQALFARLALFPGGFFAETVADIVGDPRVRDTLGALCDASLLERGVREERTRYAWLETIRVYADEKLQAIDPAERAELQRRHAGYYLAFARQQSARLRSPEEVRAITEFALELSNIRPAFSWARRHHAHDGVQLAVELYELLTTCGHWDEAMAWSDAGLHAARALNDTDSEAALLLNIGSTLYDRGALDDARQHAEASLSLFRHNASRYGEARALNLTGLIAYGRGECDTAIGYLNEALATSTREDYRALEGIILHNLGVITQHQNDHAAAQKYYREALAIRQELGDRRGIAETRNNIGVLALDLLDLPLAVESFAECLEASLELRNDIGTAVALHNLGEVAAKIDRLDYALPLLALAGQHFRRLGSALASPSSHFIDSLRDRYAPGQFDQQLARTEAVPYPRVIALAREVAALTANTPSVSGSEPSGSD